MGLAFTVTTPDLPAFHAIVAEASLGEPLQLAGAGWVGAAWPRGLYARVVDAASAPSKLELTPELAANFDRAGVSGSFIGYLRGAARGVVFERSTAGLTLQVPLLASAADYLLAARLAGAAARIAKATIEVDDPGAPEASRTYAPDALLAAWSADAAEAHARKLSGWIADDIAQGRTYYLQGPTGFVAVGPELLREVPAEERIDRVRAFLVGDRASEVASIEPRRAAILLTAAIVFAAGADGVLAEAEARQLEAHFATVAELRSHGARELMAAVRAEVSGIEALAELPSPRLRRKAFVLAAEVIGSARDGLLGGEPTDPNVQAVSAIASALCLQDDQIFLAQVVRAVMAKYEDTRGDDTCASGLALGMVMTAAADGHVDEQEAAVLAALARTVPELRQRDVATLFGAAKARLGDGVEAALGDLVELRSGKGKCFTLATEVALVAGGNPTALLPRLAGRLGLPREFADAAIATFAAKYA
jgi:hypothetical protein